MADLTLVYEDDVLRVHWSEPGRYYLSDWLGVFRKGAQLRRAYQACVELAKRHSPSVWLADTSKLPVIDPADAKWVADWFWPEFTRAGVRYMAAVSPQKVVSKMSAGRATEGLAASGSLEISVHETRAEAEAAIAAWHEKHAND
ncbi:MAG TPA: hypothetical protein VEI82_01820 [Myxococcota bacterium]|nr:hypothetical protein [Myxococcota bacterium]